MSDRHPDNVLRLGKETRRLAERIYIELAVGMFTEFGFSQKEPDNNDDLLEDERAAAIHAAKLFYKIRPNEESN